MTRLLTVVLVLAFAAPVGVEAQEVPPACDPAGTPNPEDCAAALAEQLPPPPPVPEECGGEETPPDCIPAPEAPCSGEDCVDFVEQQVQGVIEIVEENAPEQPEGDGWVAWFEFPEETRLGPNAQSQGVPLGPVLAYGPSGLTFNVHSFVDGAPQSASNVATLQVDCGGLHDVLSQVGPGCADPEGGTDAFYAAGTFVEEATPGVVTVHFTADELDNLLVPGAPFTLAHLWSHNNVDGVSSHFSVLGQAVAQADPTLADTFDHTLWHPIPIVSLRQLEESFGCTHAHAGDEGGPICDMWDGIYHVIEPQNTLTTATPAGDQPLVVLPNEDGEFVLHQKFYWMESEAGAPVQWREHNLANGHFPWTSLAVGGMPGVPETGYASLGNAHNQEYVDRVVDAENNVVVWTVEPDVFDDEANGMTFTPDETGLGLRVTQPSHVWSGAYYKPEMGASPNRVGYDQDNVDTCNALPANPSNGYTNGEAVEPMGDSRTCPESGGFLSVPKQALVGSPDTVAAPLPMLLDYMDMAATPVVFAVPIQTVDVGLNFAGDEVELGQGLPFTVDYTTFVPVESITVSDGQGYDATFLPADAPAFPPAPQGTSEPGVYNPDVPEFGVRTFTVTVTTSTGDTYAETFAEVVEVTKPALAIQAFEVPPTTQLYSRDFQATVLVAPVEVLVGDTVLVTLEDDLGGSWTEDVQVGEVVVEAKFTLNFAEGDVPGGTVALTATVSSPNFEPDTAGPLDVDLKSGVPTIEVLGISSVPGDPGFGLEAIVRIDPPAGTVLTGQVPATLTLDYLGDSPFGEAPDADNDQLDCQTDDVLLELNTDLAFVLPPCLEEAEPLTGWYALHVDTEPTLNLVAGHVVEFFNVVHGEGSSDGDVTVTDAPSELVSFVLDSAAYAAGDAITATAEIRDNNGLSTFGKLQLELQRNGVPVMTEECDDVLNGCPAWTEVAPPTISDTLMTLSHSFQLPGVVDDNAGYTVVANIVNADGSPTPLPEYSEGPSLPLDILNAVPSFDADGTSLSPTLVTVERDATILVDVNILDDNWGAWDETTQELASVTAIVRPVLGTELDWIEASSIDLSSVSRSEGEHFIDDAFTVVVPEAAAPGAYEVVLTATDDDSASADEILPFVVAPLPTVTIGDLGEFLPGADLVVPLTLSTNGDEPANDAMVGDVLVRVLQTDGPDSDHLPGGSFLDFVPATVDFSTGTATATIPLPSHLEDDFTYRVEAVVVPGGLTDRSVLEDVLVDCDTAFPDCLNVDTEAFTVAAVAPIATRTEVSLDSDPWDGPDGLIYVLPGSEGTSVTVDIAVDDLNWGTNTSLESTEITAISASASGLAAAVEDLPFAARSDGGSVDRVVTVEIPHLQAEGDYPVTVTVADEAAETSVVVTTIRVGAWFLLGLADDTDASNGLSFKDTEGGNPAPGEQATTAWDPLRISFIGSIGAEMLILEVDDFVSGDHTIDSDGFTVKFFQQDTTDPVAPDATVQNGIVLLELADLTESTAFAANGGLDVVFEFTVPVGTPSGTYTNQVTAEALQAA